MRLKGLWNFRKPARDWIYEYDMADQIKTNAEPRGINGKQTKS
jgi:hypothetical protein